MNRIVRGMTVVSALLALAVGVLWVSGYKSYPSWSLAVQHREWAMIVDRGGFRYVWRDPSSASPPPTNYRSIGFPFPLVMVVLCILPAWWARRRIIEWGKAHSLPHPRLCSECGYDLRATPTDDGPLLDRCPECGTLAFVGRSPRDPWPIKLLLTLLLIGFGGLGAGLAALGVYAARKVNDYEATKFLCPAFFFLVAAIGIAWRLWRGRQDE